MYIEIARFGSSDDYEDLYTRIATMGQQTNPQPLVVDLGSVSFVPVDGLVVLACTARLWHRWTGQKLILHKIDPKVHRYFERMDLFARCQEWLEQEDQLSVLELFDRKPHSERLLELTPIASDENQNAADVTTAVDRVSHILSNLVYQNTRSVGQLCTMLSEIAQNVVHSRDTGYAIVQRYQTNTSTGFGNAHRVVITVADLGLGIEGALKGSKAFQAQAVRDQLMCGSDFILKALELGVTSRQTPGGMGLHQVRTIVNEWEGTLSIRSSRSLITITGASITRRDDLVNIPGTHVTISVRG